jgi:hypothetical protein
LAQEKCKEKKKAEEIEDGDSRDKDEDTGGNLLPLQVARNTKRKPEQNNKIVV